MQVLYQGLLEAVWLVGGLHQNGNGLETGPPGCPPPSFAGDQLELVRSIAADLLYQDGLENAQLPYRRGQRGHGVLVEVDPGLAGVGLDAPDGNLTQS